VSGQIVPSPSFIVECHETADVLAQACLGAKRGAEGRMLHQPIQSLRVSPATNSVREPRGSLAQQYVGSAMPQSNPAICFAHIVQKGRLLQGQGAFAHLGVDAQRMLLLGPRHRLEQGPSFRRQYLAGNPRIQRAHPRRSA
jgi:hypothetical protein